MIQDGVDETANIGGAMVKAINRKPRAFQTPGEKSYSLDAHETRLRERLLLVNRFEGARLERLQRQIASNERANVGRILRRKDQMRVTLINIASNKRQIRSNVGDFERRLKNGTNSPVFGLELERIRKKEQELSGLHRRLQGPNSQLLAAHVRDELRSIESRLDANPSRLVTSQAPSVNVADTHTPGNFKPDKEQDPVTETSYQPSQQSDIMPLNNMEDRMNEVHAKMSQANISKPKHSESQHGDHDRNFPVTLPTDRAPETHPAESLNHTDPVPNPDTPVHLKDVPENTVVPVEMPDRELPPLRVTTRSKKQKYLALMQQKLSRTSNHRGELPEISNSALQRERHAMKRVAELKVKTREDIQGRRTADSDDSLGSIKLQEAVTRLQATRKGSILPSLGEEPEKSHTKARENARERARKRRQQRLATDSAATSGVSLPPLRIDLDILKELKESRLRHRKQSHKLPKLP